MASGAEGVSGDRQRASQILSLMERLGVGLLLAAALVPRARDIAGPFDREIEGFQGAFFALAAVNYERLGFGAFGGYPVLNVDLPLTSDAEGGEVADTAAWYTYPNHPPTVPLLVWASARALGPRGWNEAWKQARAPEGIELPMRLPFLALHLFALFALWWAMRQGFGPGTAMISLALASCTPVLVHYGTLVNYENALLPFVLLAYGFYARALRGRRRSWLYLAICFGLAGCVTWTPVFFLAPLVLHAMLRRRWMDAARVVRFGGLAVLAPLALHAFMAARALAAVGQAPAPPWTRAVSLLQPLLDGSAPLSSWAGRQADRISDWITWPLFIAALLGWCALRFRRPEPGTKTDRVDLATPLFLGGLLSLFAFYRHTYDPQHNFLMLVAPGIAALAACAIETLARPLFKLKAGIGPLVVVVGAFALVALASANALRLDHRGAHGLSTPGMMVPEVPLPDEIGAGIARVLPAGAVGLTPSTLGLNLAPTFYAWRTLLPIASVPDGWPVALAERFGLAEAERYVLLQTDPPHSVREQTADLRESLRALGTSGSISADWEAHRLP